MIEIAAGQYFNKFKLKWWKHKINTPTNSRHTNNHKELSDLKIIVLNNIEMLTKMQNKGNQ